MLVPKCWPNLSAAAAAAAKSLQSCPTLCDPIDGSPSGFPVPGILQARILEWVAISSSNAWNWKVKVKLLSRVQLVATPWTAAYQAPLSMGFSRLEYWSGVHCLLQFKCRSCINADWKEWPQSSHTVSACAVGSALRKCKLVLEATMQDCICIPVSGKPLSASHPLGHTM